MVALCDVCGAPLALADLGFRICVSCHCQAVFEEAPEAAGDLRLRLTAPAPGGPAGARDRGGRVWQRFAGDGATWCVLCGATVVAGWGLGAPGGPAVCLCADHVTVAPGA